MQRWPLSLLVALLLAACGGSEGTGDPERGAMLFSELPCAGCHGVAAQGQFGPTLAGTALSFAAVKDQVRSPRDEMPAFSTAQVSDSELRDIYAWLNVLPPPAATADGNLAPAAATQQALDRFYPELGAAELRQRASALDENAFRVSGTVSEVRTGGRYSEVRLLVAGDRSGSGSLELIALYDTALQRAPFPANVGDRVTLYGIGAHPVEEEDGNGNRLLLPRLQVLEVWFPVMVCVKEWRIS